MHMVLLARRGLLWLPLTVFILYLAAICFRPLLPIDETRYASVAWEMFMRQDWLKPLTMNFEPYHHKPPLLFWFIDASWAIFGVSRWAATLPVALSSLASVYLTVVLGRLLFPHFLEQDHRTAMIMVASVPFLIYSTLILFDLTLTVFVLLSLIGTFLYARARHWRHVALIGVSLGLGTLAKGPVAFLHVLFPLLLAPLWADDFKRPGRWYLGVLAALGLAAAIVLCWLIPVLRQVDGKFAYWLLWEQTAGRVVGNENTHVRPFYFYLPLLPVMVIPWIFLPRFWKGAAVLRGRFWDMEGARFLIFWVVPTIFCFCLISGKQPHYLMPLVPGVVLLTALCLKGLPTQQLAKILAVMVGTVVVGQAVASATILRRYDLAPVAAYMRAHRDRDWAFVTHYQAELGFLAQLDKPVADVPADQLAQWFIEHPDGLAIVKYKEAKDVASYHQIVDIPYQSRRMGVFSANK